MRTPNINQILRASDVASQYGAPMGARSRLDDPIERLYVQVVQMVDGDYAPDGTYWGGYPSLPLWCAFSADRANCIYVRARTRDLAVTAVLADWDAEIRQPGMPRVIEFYADPGHGWAKVRRCLLGRLGIAALVSPYSYQRGDWVYLEEDGDLSLLCTAMKEHGVTVDLRHHTTDRSSRIRNYASYTPE